MRSDWNSCKIYRSFFAAEMRYCNKERACAAVAPFSWRHFFLFFVILSSSTPSALPLLDISLKLAGDRPRTLFLSIITFLP